MIHIPPEAMAAVNATSARHDAAAQEMMRLAALDPTRPTERFDIIVDRWDEVKVEHLTAAAQLADDYFSDDERIDWTAFFDRLEGIYGIGVIDETSSAATKIQRHVREVRDAQ